MNNKIINIINVNVKNESEVLIECIYKHQKNTNPFILIESLKKENIKLKYNTVDFSNEYDVTKIEVAIRELEEDEIAIKIEENKKIYNTIVLDNKDEKIEDVRNQYIIFTKEFKIKILEDKIIIEKRKRFDKVKNEISKQVYCIRKYNRLCLIRIFARKRKKYYLFNDRIRYADDNAEQLFKHINKKHKNIAKKCYFILDKKSPKFKEMQKYGKVLKYGSLQHKIKYLNSRMVISSHASYFDRVYNPFTIEEMDVLKDIITKKFIFLQHGVIFNDVHKILNRPQIIADLFITTTKEEYKELISQKYMYDKEMVVCTGLARFDRLENSSNKTILIAPTWRAYLTNAEYGDINKEKFEKSEFYKQYKGLLENEELLDELKEKDYKIKFLLHPAFIQFKTEFVKYNNDIVEVLITDNISYSKLFKECSLFITDYSSTHFDVAFLNKPIIYYQFDKEKFYKSHYNEGYFSYEEDGFGEVVYSKTELINLILEYIENECKIKKKFEDRIIDTFKYLDNNNCERIYQQIIKIDGDDKNYRFNTVH